MVKAGAMAFKAVVPGIPKSARDQELLEEDLRQIGCHGSMGKLWGLRMEDLVVELLGKKDNCGIEPCARPRRSGQRRSGGRCMALREREKAWHPGPTGSSTVCFLVGLIPKMDML